MEGSTSFEDLEEQFNREFAELEEDESKESKTNNSKNADALQSNESESPGEDPFAPVEEALKEAFNQHRAKAKELETEDKKLAGMEARKAIGFHKELQKMEEVRKSGGSPPQFRWTSVLKEQVKRRSDLSETELELSISKLEGTYLKRNYMYFTYSIPLPKDAPTVGSTPSYWFEEDELQVPFSRKFPLLQRKKRSTRLTFNNRKVVVQIYRWHWYGRPPKLIAKVQLLLAELVEKCEVTWKMNVTDTRTGTETTTRQIWASLAIQTPLDPDKVQMETIETRELEVQWLDGEDTNSAEVNVEIPSTKDRDLAVDKDLLAPPPLLKQPSKLTQAEIENPFDLQYLVSNDVIEAELQALASKPKEEMTVDALLQQTQLQTRLDMLTASVQSGKLTLESYIQELKARVKKDKELAVHLSKNNRKPDAVAVLKRVKIMEAEITGAGALNDELQDQKQASEISQEPSPTLLENGSSTHQTQQKVELSSSMQSLDETDFSLPPGVSEEELSDPLSVKLLLSNDVLEAEVQAIEEKYGENCPVDLVMRKLQLQASLDMLLASVQNGSLSMEDYIARLKERVLKDKILAVHLKGDRQSEAVSVMRRIKIMEAEIHGAAERSEEEEEGVNIS